MTERDQTPGPLAGEKSSDQSPRGERQPEAAEVESARMLANQARERLNASGVDDPTIERLADRYIAEDRGEDLDAFIAWARENAER